MPKVKVLPFILTVAFLWTFLESSSRNGDSEELVSDRADLTLFEAFLNRVGSME